MNTRQESVIVRMTCRLFAPFIQLFGLYVIVHGHTSPGGGFQGGVILASSFVLLTIGFGPDAIRRRVSLPALLGYTCAGVLLYAGIGVACVALGANFLDYGALPLPDARSLGMLGIEIGVGVTVAAAMVSIFYDLVTFE